jgi:hypothetical protein
MENQLLATLNTPLFASRPRSGGTLCITYDNTDEEQAMPTSGSGDPSASTGGSFRSPLEQNSREATGNSVRPRRFIPPPSPTGLGSVYVGQYLAAAKNDVAQAISGPTAQNRVVSPSVGSHQFPLCHQLRRVKIQDHLGSSLVRKIKLLSTEPIPQILVRGLKFSARVPDGGSIHFYVILWVLFSRSRTSSRDGVGV